MRVPFYDPRRGGAELDAALKAAFARVLESGRYVLGPEVEAFEAACADTLGAKHAIGVSSGTDALLVALMALGVGPGDEVICPTYTFVATVEAVARSGARPVLVDVRPCCMNIDPARVLERVSPKTRAIVAVHLFGQCAEIEPLLEVARARGIAVIEDAAQAFGASQTLATTNAADATTVSAGAAADVGCLSFFPTKNLGGFGDGGLVVTGDDALAARARALRSHGASAKQRFELLGGNFRLDALQAALLSVMLPRVSEAIAARRATAASYTAKLTAAGIAALAPSCRDGQRATAASCSDGQRASTRSPLVLPPECRPRHTFNQFVVRVPGPGERDRLRAALTERGIGTQIYYPTPNHLQPVFAQLGYGAGDLPVAEAASAESLALPIFPGLEPAEIDHVVSALVDALGEAR